MGLTKERDLTSPSYAFSKILLFASHPILYAVRSLTAITEREGPESMRREVPKSSKEANSLSLPRCSREVMGLGKRQ